MRNCVCGKAPGSDGITVKMLRVQKLLGVLMASENLEWPQETGVTPRLFNY